MLDQLQRLVGGVEIGPVAILDIALTALVIYGLFSLIRGTRAVRLVIGATTLYVVYVLAQALNLPLFTQMLQAGAVVGLIALVVIFQPELRRALERIGRVSSLNWLFAPTSHGEAGRVAEALARTAAQLAVQRVGALIVIERETGLQDAAESGVMLHADLSPELLRTIFMPRSPLHDGAVIIRGERVIAAGAVLPLSEISTYRERFGTRHRAALGITEQTDALAVVVSEESGAVSLVQRGQILRHLDEERLRTALVSLLQPANARTRAAIHFPERQMSSARRRFRLRAARSKRWAAARAGTPPSSTSETSAGGVRPTTPASTPAPRVSKAE